MQLLLSLLSLSLSLSFYLCSLTASPPCGWARWSSQTEGLSADLMVAGVVIFSRRSRAIAAWLTGLDLAFVSAVLESREIYIEARTAQPRRTARATRRACQLMRSTHRCVRHSCDSDRVGGARACVCGCRRSVWTRSTSSLACERPHRRSRRKHLRRARRARAYATARLHWRPRRARGARARTTRHCSVLCALMTSPLVLRGVCGGGAGAAFSLRAEWARGRAAGRLLAAARCRCAQAVRNRGRDVARGRLRERMRCGRTRLCLSPVTCALHPHDVESSREVRCVSVAGVGYSGLKVPTTPTLTPHSASRTGGAPPAPETPRSAARGMDEDPQRHLRSSAYA